MAFRTVYKEDYIEHSFKSMRDYDPICAELFKKEKIKKSLTSKTDSIKASYTPEEKEELIRNRWDRFYKTIYRKSYCQKPVKADKIISEGVMMMEMEKLFEAIDKGYIMPRVPGVERVMGFASKDENNTPLTTYQNAYDRVGYFVIKTNKERIAKKEADKHRVSVADRERVTIPNRKQSGEKIVKKKNYSNTSISSDQPKDKNKSNSSTRQIFFVTPENTSEKHPLRFEFDTKNKNI
ncbi:uncharacterized protein LOC123298701 [Chrysoperla carnea]|uniref:uncharacterized protein LOC123298701 n=1 Tax=Chrysoperla carnea TaxID=189513 RepID=UPI001D093956|nr:uncharacterized protein LOC123298701 [Chrysoperla carnea]